MSQPRRYCLVTLFREEHNPMLQNARERVSFLTWALQRHRGPDKTRSRHWRQLEAEYVRQLNEARQELQRLEQDSP
jgi:hypothetical protein